MLHCPLIALPENIHQTSGHIARSTQQQAGRKTAADPSARAQGRRSPKWLPTGRPAILRRHLRLRRLPLPHRRRRRSHHHHHQMRQPAAVHATHTGRGPMHRQAPRRPVSPCSAGDECSSIRATGLDVRNATIQATGMLTHPVPADDAGTGMGRSRIRS